MRPLLWFLPVLLLAGCVSRPPAPPPAPPRQEPAPVREEPKQPEPPREEPRPEPPPARPQPKASTESPSFPLAVGHFEAPDGEAIDIQLDGRIFYLYHDHSEFVGLVNVVQEFPIVVSSVGPENVPLVGTKISYTPDRRSITVVWPLNTRSPGLGSASKATTYQVK